ncbi:MAG: hypothetical protein H7Y11_12925 [Armatimonadetes bacterium]|nr:hypothetical protein [Anaerolineae bacterium]
MTNMDNDIPTESLAETENYLVWVSEDDGELVYNIELDNVTLHFLREEWQEFLKLMADAAQQDA